MPMVCWECGRVHRFGATCEENKKGEVEWKKQLDKDVAEHIKECPGCPDPERHVLNLRRAIDSSSENPSGRIARSIKAEP